MRAKRANPSPKRGRVQKKRVRASAKRTTKWADPAATVTKMAKRRKTRSKKADLKKNSCWWFG
jgi:hypothetical protein